MLGHNVQFSYCRQTGAGLFCRKAVDCWAERFDVQAFLREAFTSDQIREVMQPPQPKMNSLIELIAKARGSEKPS